MPTNTLDGSKKVQTERNDCIQCINEGDPSQCRTCLMHKRDGVLRELEAALDEEHRHLAQKLVRAQSKYGRVYREEKQLREQETRCPVTES